MLYSEGVENWIEIKFLSVNIDVFFIETKDNFRD